MNSKTLLDLLRDPMESIEAIATRIAAATPAERAVSREQLIALSNSAETLRDAVLRTRVETLQRLLEETDASGTRRRHGDASGPPRAATNLEGPVTQVADAPQLSSVAEAGTPSNTNSTRIRTQPGDGVAGNQLESGPGWKRSETMIRYPIDSGIQRASVGGTGSAESDSTAATRPRQRGLSGGPAEQQSRTPRRCRDLDRGDVVHGWYRLESRLGVGAMGQVWRAVDLQMERARAPDSQVALKLLSEEFGSHEHAMVAMSREADKAKKLAHPNIATVFVFAVDPESGQSYLAMELLKGKPLDRMIRECPDGIDRGRALDIIRGLARGLGYAHSKNIVHCDFKPGNAFVTETGVAKLMDFGIARLAQEVARAGDHFDAGVLAALTPPYASLEMLQEERPQPDPADDVYALGLVAYEVITGRHPFGGKWATEVLQDGDRPKPIKGLRRREWRTIERALQLRRAERWPDANEFLKALEGVSPWVPALSGLAATLAIVAGYVAYQNHLESQPKVPFEQLSAQDQIEFRSAMRDGDYAYRFGTTELVGSEATEAIYRDALGRYIAAYATHPKNAEAEAAIRRSLEFLSARLETADPVMRAEARGVLEGYRSQYSDFAKYQPLERAIAKLSD